MKYKWLIIIGCCILLFVCFFVRSSVWAGVKFFFEMPAWLAGMFYGGVIFVGIVAYAVSYRRKHRATLKAEKDLKD